MTILPLIERELGVRARRKATYWSRFGVGMGGVILCLPKLLLPDWMNMAGGAAGKALFDSLIIMAFALCCAACFATMDAISAEAREGTLGLLFLTRVRWFDVIAGKLVSNGLGFLATLAALLPLLMIPVLAGGVTGGEAFRKGLVLVNTAFLCLAIGLSSSAFERENFKAIRRTMVWLILILLVAAAIPEPFRLIWPVGALTVAGDSEYRAVPWHFWASLAVVQGMAWLFLLSAGEGLRKGVREEQTTSAEAVMAAAGSQWLRKGLQHGPVEWAVGRGGGLKAILWAAAVVGMVYIFFYRALSAWSGVGRFSGFWLVGSWLPQTAFSGMSAALFAWAASRFLIESRRTGELELLLTTPMGAQTLAHEHWRVLRNELRWPLLAMVVAVLLQFAVGVVSRASFGGTNNWLFQYGLSCAFSIVSTVVSVGAICRVGLWLGMKASSQSRAIISTVLLAKGVPYIIGLFWALLMAASGMWIRGPSSFYYMALVPQIGTLMFYFWIIRVAKRGLSRDLAGPGEGDKGLAGALASIREDLAGGVVKCREWKVT